MLLLILDGLLHDLLNSSWSVFQDHLNFTPPNIFQTFLLHIIIARPWNSTEWCNQDLETVLSSCQPDLLKHSVASTSIVLPLGKLKPFPCRSFWFTFTIGFGVFHFSPFLIREVHPKCSRSDCGFKDRRENELATKRTVSLHLLLLLCPTSARGWLQLWFMLTACRHDAAPSLNAHLQAFRSCWCFYLSHCSFLYQTLIVFLRYWSFSQFS